MRLPLRRRVIFAEKWMLQLKTEKEAPQDAFSRPSWFENPGPRAVLGGLNRFTKKMPKRSRPIPGPPPPGQFWEGGVGAGCNTETGHPGEDNRRGTK